MSKLIWDWSKWLYWPYLQFQSCWGFLWRLMQSSNQRTPTRWSSIHNGTPLDGYSNIHFGVWGCPSICSETQLPLMFLVQSEYTSSDVNVNTWTDLKHLSEVPSYSFKNLLDISGNGWTWWWVILRPPHFHDSAQATVFNNTERVHTLSHSMNDLHTVKGCSAWRE